MQHKALPVFFYFVENCIIIIIIVVIIIIIKQTLEAQITVIKLQKCITALQLCTVKQELLEVSLERKTRDEELSARVTAGRVFQAAEQV